MDKILRFSLVIVAYSLLACVAVALGANETIGWLLWAGLTALLIIMRVMIMRSPLDNTPTKENR